MAPVNLAEATATNRTIPTVRATGGRPDRSMASPFESNHDCGVNAVNVKKRAQQVAGFSYDCVSVPSGFGQNWMSTQVPFGDFVLDLDSRELRRGGQPLRLSPKALQL